MDTPAQDIPDLKREYHWHAARLTAIDSTADTVDTVAEYWTHMQKRRSALAAITGTLVELAAAHDRAGDRPAALAIRELHEFYMRLYRAANDAAAASRPTVIAVEHGTVRARCGRLGHPRPAADPPGRPAIGTASPPGRDHEHAHRCQPRQ
ncbi:hypothetical protein [Streptomyces sp. Ac-502]|uniref:hypothetical protein n=1 Tax=Streptomyces sp. Ac-502 TaxID=3342801 RepID=UPI0038623A69